MALDKVIDSAQLDGALTATADAIRIVKDSSDPIEWDADTGFADALSDISSGLPTQEKTITITENGTVEVLPDEGYALSKVTATTQVYDVVDDRFYSLVDGSMTELSDESITKLRGYAFAYSEITHADLPNVTSVGAYAFYQADKLVSVNMPNVETLGNGTFACTQNGYAPMRISNLTSVNFPKITGIPEGCFKFCYNLSSISVPNVVRIEEEAFRHSLRNMVVEFPKVTALGSYAFKGCLAAEISLPKVESISMSMFTDCTNLVYANLPVIATAPQNAFSKCVSLERADMRACSKIETNVFNTCTKFNLLVLGKTDKICTVSHISAFNSTTFASGGTGGICLVPRDLIESYQTATNWSTLYAAGTCLFWALEDYTVDGTTTGEIDWDKLNTDREGAFA